MDVYVSVHDAVHEFTYIMEFTNVVEFEYVIAEVLAVVNEM